MRMVPELKTFDPVEALFLEYDPTKGAHIEPHFDELHTVVVTEQFAEHVAVGSLAARLELEFAELQVPFAGL